MINPSARRPNSARRPAKSSGGASSRRRVWGATYPVHAVPSQYRHHGPKPGSGYQPAGALTDERYVTGRAGRRRIEHSQGQCCAHAWILAHGLAAPRLHAPARSTRPMIIGPCHLAPSCSPAREAPSSKQWLKGRPSHPSDRCPRRPLTNGHFAGCNRPSTRSSASPRSRLGAVTSHGRRHDSRVCSRRPSCKGGVLRRVELLWYVSHHAIVPRAGRPERQLWRVRSVARESLAV
jgi:hypothetical protein